MPPRKRRAGGPIGHRGQEKSGDDRPQIAEDKRMCMPIHRRKNHRQRDAPGQHADPQNHRQHRPERPQQEEWPKTERKKYHAATRPCCGGPAVSHLPPGCGCGTERSPSSAQVNRTIVVPKRKVTRKRPASSPSPFSNVLVIRPSRINCGTSAGAHPINGARSLASTVILSPDTSSFMSPAPVWCDEGARLMACWFLRGP